ncbi:MAG: sugar phosphate isomerase/epimerase [Deltaproteobacteria bacterium]|nr:sugar phosphate isomerase/epimerase [Deltaproteobacteria bacterium]
MLALSTSWRSSQITDARALLQSFDRLPISGLELDYRISEQTFEQIKSLLPQSRLEVVSVHNYFPTPVVEPSAAASGDFFMLSSLDQDERNRAVLWTRRTIEHAAHLGARAVVLHCGRVEMERELDRLYAFYDALQIRSKAARDFISRKLAERDRLKPPHMDNLLLSLEALCEDAARHGILLGLENRFHYDELPTLDDFEQIFDRLDGSPLGYWHDTGHARVNECLKILQPDSLLSRYTANLIGVHIHDAIGLEDHLAPGTGEMNLQALLSDLKSDTLKVIELRPKVRESDAIQGIHYIRRILSE